jgi:hypothetical protein
MDNPSNEIEYIVNRLFEAANVPFDFTQIPKIDYDYKEQYPISSEQYKIWEWEIQRHMASKYNWKRKKTRVLLKWVKNRYGVKEDLAS